MDRRLYILGRDTLPQSISLGEGQSMEIVLLALPGTDCHMPLQVDITGPGAELSIWGLYICKDAEKLGLDICVRHLSGGSVSRQLLKGIVSGCARTAFHGLIYVAQDAQKTEAYQENHNLLLSQSATVETDPQLEIYADDVKCSHGATIGALNPDELFYMRSRGIPLDEARALQMLSFVSPILSHIADESMREEVLDALNTL